MSNVSCIIYASSSMYIHPHTYRKNVKLKTVILQHCNFATNQKYFTLTHWGRVTHICVGILTSTGSNNGLSPGRRQAIIWTNAGILLIQHLGTNFSEILIRIQAFSFQKIHLKMSSAKWRPFCLGLNVLSGILWTSRWIWLPNMFPWKQENLSCVLHRSATLMPYLSSIMLTYLEIIEMRVFFFNGILWKQKQLEFRFTRLFCFIGFLVALHTHVFNMNITWKPTETETNMLMHVSYA